MTVRKFLSQPVRFALTAAIVENYAASGLTDPEFVEKFNKEHSATAGTHQVAQIRKAFNIPGNRPNLVGTGTSIWKTNIERRLEALERRVDVYIGPGK